MENLQARYPGAQVNWTTTEYDERSRMMRVTTPDQRSTSFSYGYTQLGGITVVTDPNGKVTSTYFNARGSVSRRVAAVGTSQQQETAYGYDALERPTSMTPPGQQPITFTYDTLGRRRTFTDPQLANRTVTFTYDALNRVKTQQIAGGDTISLDYDESTVTNGLGRLTKVTDKSGITHFGYDTMGRLSSVSKDVEGGLTLSQTYLSNYIGQTTRITYPDPAASYVDYTFTMGGHLWNATLTSGPDSGVVATWSNYTASGRPQNVSYRGGAVATTYGFDTMDHPTSVYTANSATVLQNLTYDWYARANTGGINLGQILDSRTSAQKTATGVDTDESQTYSYDDLYRLTQAVFAWGTKDYTGYDAAGNLANFGGLANRTLGFNGQLLTSITANGVTSQVAHDGFGNMTHKELDGTAWDYTWTEDNFLETASKNGVLTAEMTYDAWGQRSKKVFHAASGSSVTTLYFGRTYEKRTYSDGALAQHTIYIYANGQVIAQVTKAGSSATALNSPYRWRNELAAASLYNGHDIKGALKKTYHYLNAAALHPDSARWVVLAFLLLILTGVLASLVASKLGHAALPTNYSPGLRWASLSVLMLFIFSACGGGGPGGGGLYSVANYVVSDNTLQGPIEGTLFYHRNHINSTSIVTKSDGTEYSRHLYVPYGELAKDRSSGGDAVTRKFTGQERDEETGIDYFNARYYDPAIGRFVSADTIIPDVLNGQAFNRYAYVLNNPVMHDDPTGHIAALVALGIAYACFEFASSMYDLYSALETIADPNATPADAALAVAAVGLGIVAPGPGRAYTQGIPKALEYGERSAKSLLTNKAAREIVEETAPKAVRAAEAVHGHHPFAMYLGGKAKQELENLPASLHNAYHAGLDKIAARAKGKAHYDALPKNEKDAILKDVQTYTKAFDKEHGTNLVGAMKENGFPDL